MEKLKTSDCMKVFNNDGTISYGEFKRDTI